jgi:hypothetical protein
VTAAESKTMKKAELEGHFRAYETLVETIQTMVGNRRIRGALSTCLSSFPHVVPMTMYRKREGMEPDFPELVPFDAILRYAPPLFEHATIQSLQEFAQTTRQLSRHPNEYAKAIEAALEREDLARRVWNRVERDPGVMQDDLCRHLGVSENRLLEIVGPWEYLGVARRKRDGTDWKLRLVSCLDEQMVGVCPVCGTAGRGQRSTLFCQVPCKGCGTTGYYHMKYPES